MNYAIVRLIDATIGDRSDRTFMPNKTSKIMTNAKTWFITGASRGLGLHLTKMLLKNGHRVVATSRDGEQLRNIVGAAVRASAGAQEKQECRWVREWAGEEEETREQPYLDNFLSLSVNLTCEDQVQTAIRQTVQRFGSIDVVVNYAGYHSSDEEERGEVEGDAVEGLGDPITSGQFEVNVFGAFHVLKQVAPYLRSQGYGYVLNFSSAAVIEAAARDTLYAATKLAIQSLSESILGELNSKGILLKEMGPEAGENNPAKEACSLIQWVFNQDSIIWADHQVNHHPRNRHIQPYRPGNLCQSAMFVKSLLKSPLQGE